MMHNALTRFLSTQSPARYGAAMLAAGTVSITVALTTITGCNGVIDSTPEGVTRIEIWQGFNAEETTVLNEILAEYETAWEKENGGDLQINVQYVSFGDMFTKLRTAALAKSTPDIAFIDSIKVTDLAFGEALLPLNKLDSFNARYDSLEDARTEFVTASFNAGVINRLGEVNLYGLPVQTTTVALFWNREMFRRQSADLRAAGLDPNRAPQNWDELAQYAQILTNPTENRYGYGAHRSMWFNFPIFNMYGMEFVEYGPNGEVIEAFNTEQGKAALVRLQTLATSDYEGGAWKQSGSSPDEGFINSRYAMILTGPWQVTNFANAGVDFDISLIPAPTDEEINNLNLQPIDAELVAEIGNAGYTSSNVGGQTGVILKMSENPDVAFEIIEHFTSETVQRRWASGLGQIPVRKAAWKDLDMSAYPYMKTFMQQIRTSKRIPQIPYYGILESDIFNPQIDLLLRDQLTPEDMLTRMEKGFKERILVKINTRQKTPAD
ncbi:MAG: extracellular solute-binding protein [Sumerlaeia bacterium]